MSSKGTILVVDDFDPKVIADELETKLPGIRTVFCKTMDEAVKIIHTESINVVIADMRMESAEAGYDLLLIIKKQNPKIQVIVLTAFSTLEGAVKCMRAGCFDYLEKKIPLVSDKLVESTQRALELSRSGLDVESLVERLILADWDEIRRAVDSAKKGAALESLCNLLFRTIPGWERIESRIRSGTEEIDLVILNESQEEFWRRYRTFILVECKNWTGKGKPGRVEFDAFYQKIKRRGQTDCRLGFFVSLRGVAKTFITELERIAKEDVVIVLLSEDELWHFTCSQHRSDFLKGQLTKQILGKSTIDRR